jgi:hypothetical protein
MLLYKKNEILMTTQTNPSTGAQGSADTRKILNGKTIMVRSGSILNEYIVNDLSDLFDFVPPRKLKAVITEIFLLLIASDYHSPEDYHEMAKVLNLLFGVLDRADEFQDVEEEKNEEEENEEEEEQEEAE